MAAPYRLPRNASFIVLALLSSLALLLTGCGGGGSSAAAPSNTSNNPPLSSSVSHVILVVIENQDYSVVVGNPAMPYLNGLLQRGALATQYFANAHPSIGNYFIMTTGEAVTNDDNFSGVVSGDNLARELASASKSWRLYAEGLPRAGYLGPDVYPYVRHHSPFAYFSDVQSDPAQSDNIVPLTQLASDEAAGTMPTFAMLVPDQRHNTHDCAAGVSTCSLSDRLAAADQWLLTNVDPLLSVPESLVVITFDESASDNTHGGGQVATILLGARVKAGFRSTTLYQHQSLYRFVLERSGIGTLPPSAASAPSMDEFLQ
jgi:phosphatidylinositol-3-phosphatase